MPPLSEFLWMMGVLVNLSSNSLPIIHPFNDRASFGIMTGIGLFSDSIHSICSAFAPLELIFFLILLFLHFHYLFYLCYDAGASINTPNIGNSALITEELD